MRDWPVKDLAAAAALLVLAGAYGVATRTIETSSLSDAVGERGLPNILTVLLVLVALAIAGKALIERRRPEKASDDEEERAPVLRALGFLAIGIGYIVIAPIVGYGVGIALLIAAVALYEGIAWSWRVAAVAAGGGLVFYLGFVALLGVEQPISILIGR